MLNKQLLNLHTQTMKLAVESFVITVFFVLWATFINTKFCILVGGTGRNIPLLVRPFLGFSSDLYIQVGCPLNLEIR